MLHAEAHGDGDLADVHALRCRVHRHDPRVRVVARNAGAALHGHVLVTVHVDAEVEDVVSGAERGAQVAELFARVRAGDVVTEVGEQRRARRIEREGGIGYRGQRVVFDLRELAAVLGEAPALGDDYRYGIADEAHLVGRKQGELGGGAAAAHESRQRIRPRDGHRFEFRSGERRDDPGQRPRRRDIDGEHTRVRQR